MRILFATKFQKALLKDIQAHAEKTQESAWVCQQAMECYVSDNCNDFSEFRQKTLQHEKDAATIKQRIYDAQARGLRQSLYKSLLIKCLAEQEKIVDSVQRALTWVSFKEWTQFPQKMEKDFFLFLDLVIEPIEEHNKILSHVSYLLSKNSKKRRKRVRDGIEGVFQKALDAKKAEDAFQKKIFTLQSDPTTVFHLIRLEEIIGAIAIYGKRSTEAIHELISS